MLVMAGRTKLSRRREQHRKNRVCSSWFGRTVVALSLFGIVLFGYVVVIIHSNAQQVTLSSLTDHLATVSTAKNRKEIMIATLLGATVDPLLTDMVLQDRGLEYFSIEPAGFARK